MYLGTATDDFLGDTIAFVHTVTVLRGDISPYSLPRVDALMRGVYDVSRDYLPDVCSTYRRNRKMDQERLNDNTAQNQTNSCSPSASTQ